MGESMPEPFKIHFSGSIKPYKGLMTASPIGLSNLGVSRFISQVQALKVGVADVQLNPLAPQRQALGFEFPPNCGSLREGWGL